MKKKILFIVLFLLLLVVFVTVGILSSWFSNLDVKTWFGKSEKLNDVSSVSFIDDVQNDMATKLEKVPKEGRTMLYVMSNLNDKITSYSLRGDYGTVNEPKYVDIEVLHCVADKSTFLNFANRGGSYTLKSESGESLSTSFDTTSMNLDSVINDVENPLFRFFTLGFYTDVNLNQYSLKTFYTNAFIMRSNMDGFFTLETNCGKAKDESIYIYYEFDVKVCSLGFQYLDSSGKWQTTYKKVEYGTRISKDIVSEIDYDSALYASFVGWSRPFGTVTTDLLFVANYKYTEYLISYRAYDGTLVRTDKCTYYKVIPSYTLNEYEKIENNVRYTYKFLGWSTVENAEVVEDITKIVVDQDITLYPVYALAKTTDLKNGKEEVLIPDDENKVGLFEWIGKAWTWLGNIPIIGVVLQVVACILFIPIAIGVIWCIVKLIQIIYTAIKGLISLFRNRKSNY